MAKRAATRDKPKPLDKLSCQNRVQHITNSISQLANHKKVTMAVPTYEELLARCDLYSSCMDDTFSDNHLRELSSMVDRWERLAKFLGMPNSDIDYIKSQGDAEEQRLQMLECWKQRCGSAATYKTMIKALLQINRTDLAEKVTLLRQSISNTHTLESISQAPLSPREIWLATPTSPASSSGTEMSPPAAMSPLTPLTITDEQTAQVVKETLQTLEEEFYDLVIYTEDTLENSKVSINTVTRRFRMLPRSIKRQHQTDENYKETRQKILDSRTVKKLLDNLTELKHWNYMTPDTLIYILKDVNIDNVHRKIGEYKGKLLAFKAKTKLRELINTSFPVPDYCMELTMKVEGWEDKTIQEVENRAVNIT